MEQIKLSQEMIALWQKNTQKSKEEKNNLYAL